MAETLLQKIERTGQMLVDLGNFAAEVRALAEQCDPQAAAEATTLELPAIIEQSLGVSNEQHDAEIAALQEQIAQLQDKLLEAYEEVDAMRAQRDHWIAYALKSLNYTDEECAECIEDVPDITTADVDYSRQILAEWNPETTTLVNKFKGDKKLKLMPKIDMGKVTNITSAWYECASLKYMPLLDWSSVTTGRFVFYSANNAVPLVRLQDFDTSNISDQNDLFGGLARCRIFPKRLDLRKLSDITNLFIGDSLLTNDNMPQLELNPDILTTAVQPFSEIGITRLPVTDFGNCTDLTNVYRFNNFLGDCSDQTLSWTTDKEVDVNTMFFYSTAIERLGESPLFIPPRFADGANIGNMEFYLCGTAAKVPYLPDYSNIAPKRLGNFMALTGSDIPSLWPYPMKCERIEGLNFARLESTRSAKYPTFGMFGTGEYSANSNMPIANGDTHLNLRYIRIINLGQGSCTDIDLHGVSNWGDGDAENLQSLVDSLITNSYDRAAAGMETCVLTLPKQVWARLTEAQQAEVTAKGFSVVLSNY